MPAKKMEAFIAMFNVRQALRKQKAEEAASAEPGIERTPLR